MQIITDERSAQAFLEMKASESMANQTDIIALSPPEYEAIVALHVLAWTQSPLDGTYKNYWRDKHNCRWRVQCRLAHGVGRFTSLTAAVNLLGAV